MTDTGHLYVTWERYHRLIDLLALQVHDSKWEFDNIIAIARGGLRVGDQLSRIFDKPLAIMSTSSYVEDGGTVRGKLLVSEHLTMTSASLVRSNGVRSASTFNPCPLRSTAPR